MIRKVAIVAMVLMMIVGSVFAQDFRGIEWGAGPNRVYYEEGTDYGQDTGNIYGKRVIAYSRFLLDREVAVQYRFISEKLRWGAIAFMSDSGAPVNRLENALTTKYGEPMTELPDYVDPEKAALLVDSEQKKRLLIWETNATVLGMVREVADTGEETLAVIYYDKSYVSVATAENDAEGF